MLGSLLESYRSVFRGLSREVWVLSLVLLVNRSGTMVLPFLALYLTTQKGYEPSEAGAFLAVYGAGSMLGIVVGGRLSDVIGFKRVQLFSLVGAGALFFVLGLVQSGVAILVTVGALGLVAEAFRPASSAAVAAFSEPHERTRAYGLQRLAINLGWTIGPAVGGFLALVDYHLLFWVDGSTCLAAAALLAIALPEQERSEEGDDTRRTAAGSPWRDGAYVVGLLLLLLQAMVFFQLMSTFPLFLRQERAFTEDLVGLTVAANTVVIVLLEMQLIRAVQRFDPLKVVGVAGLLTGLGYGLLPYVSTLIGVMGTVVVWTFGEMLSAPVAMAWSANRSEESNRGRYMGAHALVYSVAIVVSPLLGTWVYEHLGSDVLWHGSLLLGALDLAGFYALATWLSRGRRDAKRPRSS